MAKVQIQIPKEYVPGFAKLFRLDEERVEQLVLILRGAPLKAGRDALMEALAGPADFLSADDFREMLTAILSLYDLRNQLEEPVPVIIDAVLEASARSKADELALDDQSKERVRRGLDSLLSIEALECRSKVADLSTANQDTFLAARVITDVRPVFGGDVDGRPAAAILVHFLRLRYMRASVPREFHVALDSGDIDDLIEVLQRAKAKSKSLERLLEAVSIPYVTGE